MIASSERIEERSATKLLSQSILAPHSITIRIRILTVNDSVYF